jgi:hypothetical protein
VTRGTQYRHFKGGLYVVEGLALRVDGDAEEEMVVYRPEGSPLLFVRSRANFEEQVERDGYRGPRFVPEAPA